MSDSVLISVIVPVYNVSQYLKRCVDSIINQTYRDIQIILIDDGSVDGSGLICDQLEEIHSNICVVHQENKGITSARKKGISVACGSYIGFVDPDDWIEPEMYEKLFEKINHADGDIVCSGIKREKDGEVYTTWAGTDYEEGIYFDDSLKKLKLSLFDNKSIRISGSMCNKLFKKELLEDILSKVDDQLRGVGDDTACVIPYILKSNCVVILNEAFYHGCERCDSATHSRHLSWYLQANLTYIRLKESICESGMEEILMPALDKIWEMVIINGLKNYFPNKYDYRVNLPELYNVKKANIILYGAGCVGCNFFYQISNMANLNIVSWIDKYRAGMCVGDVQIASVNRINELSFDWIIVAVGDEKIASDIIKELIYGQGIDKQKIIWRIPLSFYEYCFGKGRF